MTPASLPAVGDARGRLLAAGRRLSELGDRAGITVEAVCDTAGLGPERFFELYRDLRAYHCELLGQLIDEVRDAVARITGNMSGGIPRLKLAIETYLEANVLRPTLRELTMELRFDPVGAAVIRQRVAGFKTMLQIELGAAGWPHAAAVARLMTAAVLEIAQAEQEAGARLPGMRRTVFRYFDSTSS